MPGRNGGARHFFSKAGAAGMLALLAMFALSAGAPRATAAPERVVSLNVCTDQLAMMLAAPGQLVAVSALARDARMSAMVTEAARYRITHGSAEDVFRLAPDLVLTGSFTTPHTTAMLRRLGVEVAEFTPTDTMDGVREDILRLGSLLGRVAEAEALVAEFDADLAALAEEVAARPDAVLYYANGYTSGSRTLAGAILAAAGLTNLADAAGIEWGGMLALERLVMLAPDLVVTGERYPGASRSEELLAHPALQAMRATAGRATVADADWVCGTPHVLRAVAKLRAAREALE